MGMISIVTLALTMTLTLTLMVRQDALLCLYDLERSAEHDDSVLWATCGELLIRLWATVCGGADASEEQARSRCCVLAMLRDELHELRAPPCTVKRQRCCVASCQVRLHFNPHRTPECSPTQPRRAELSEGTAVPREPARALTLNPS